MSVEENFFLPIRIEEYLTPHSFDAISIDDIKLHLNIEDDEDDVLLLQYRDAAVILLESWLGMNFLDGEFTAIYNYCNCICGFEIRQMPFQSIISIEYYANGQYNTLSDDFFFIRKTAYETLCVLKEPISSIYNKTEEPVKIIFSSGFGADESSVPQDIKMSLKIMIAMMYNNRGDCADSCGVIPCMAQKFAKKYRRITLRKSRNDCCNCIC